MHLWRKLVAPRWLIANEAELQSRTGDRLAIIERPTRKKLTLEVVCKTSVEARRLTCRFGGQVERIPHDWLKRYSGAEKRPPLRIGGRLVITSRGTSRRSANEVASHLVIPAGAAFGTGAHVTTAMSLRLLELITRGMKTGWSVADLGTGSGILALAAYRFGARHILAVDNDPRAIAVAKENARLNHVSHIEFQIADVNQWRPSARIDILVANLFSELLMGILPRLKASLRSDGRLILSGVMRNQERDLKNALRRNKIDIVQARRRGKWIAMLCSGGL